MSPFDTNHGKVVLFHRHRINFEWLDGRAVDELLTRISEQSMNLVLNTTTSPRGDIKAGDQSRDGNCSTSDSDPTTDLEKTPDASEHELQCSISTEEEVAHLKRELASAFQKIANLDEELTQNRSLMLSMDQLVASPVETVPRSLNYGRAQQYSPVPQRYSHAPSVGRASGFQVSGDARFGFGKPLDARSITSPQSIWSNHHKSGNGMETSMNVGPSITVDKRSTTMGPVADQSGVVGGVSLVQLDQGRFHESHHGPGVADTLSRPVSAISADATFCTAGRALTSRPESLNRVNGSQFHPNTRMPRPVGSRSPPNVNFGWQNPQVLHGPWNNRFAMPASSHNRGNAIEPMNYRRLLDHNMSCNWKFVVDKIVCNNDQQASIFLQQKLKLGTQEQKYEIVQAIVAQAYPLMTNRFGNFLVQRCFEHGTPDQIVAIANAIRGNTLALSMDAFGCHVVQKAFDCVPEEFKAVMVHELLRRIPDTVIHRYACHVWQKLFELRWNDSPPQIMKYVNEALRGMWHEVALGETGSLVVQNIFENCREEDKRPCVDEVLSSIDVIAHGQFGNWCIQHICEYGAPADRNRAIDHILRFATEYSTDQHASKVIEKCLKIGGNEFLDKYLDRICQSRADRPRIPLIDISSHQFGNYLIQWILTNSSARHRQIVASHIRKHMVSLRGSKYGSRVANLCSNPVNQIQPGPSTGLIHRGFSYNGFDRGRHVAAFH